MRSTSRASVSHHYYGRYPLTFVLLAAVMVSGCGGTANTLAKPVSEAPTVGLIRPQFRSILRVVGQPSFIESFERTSVYPKLSAYIERWNVDIGDKVKKGDVLATLFVPELVESHRTKIADVQLDKERIELARKEADVAGADVKAARARVAEVRSDLKKFQADVDRWDEEVKRLTAEVQKKVVDPSILAESTNQYKSAAAARDAAKAVITTAEAELLAREAKDAKANVAVDVARAALDVAESEERRLKAWIGYLTLTAPFDGVVVVRNANTFDFVLPSTGDPTAMPDSPDQSPALAAPIYVVDRTDKVRIFVDVPEQDANFVRPGTKATVLARAFRDEPLSAAVTRTSWALNVESYTLRAEIDLANVDGGLLPGMYAYVKVIIEHPRVMALPQDALIYSGDKTFFWGYENGKAVRTEVRTGVNDDEWVEVTSRRVKPLQSTPSGHESWTPMDGSEQVIRGELSILADGGPVTLTQADERAGARGEAPSAARHAGQGGSTAPNASR
jgi:multidrug efflux pump subunit AcrA (membrane-fusion protein)